MGKCKCGFTRNEEGNCDGTHKVVKEMKAAEPEISDADFEVFVNALLSGYNGPGYMPE